MLDFTPERIVRDLVVLAILGVLFSLSSLVSNRPCRDVEGWNLLRPGLLHWLCVVGCVLFVGFVLFFGVTHGIASKNVVPFGAMVVCFTGGGAFIGVHVIRLKQLALRWKNGTLVFNDSTGVEVVRFMDEINQVEVSRGGEMRLTFKDGAWLKVDTTASGSGAFLRAIAERLSAEHAND